MLGLANLEFKTVLYLQNKNKTFQFEKKRYLKTAETVNLKCPRFKETVNYI